MAWHPFRNLWLKALALLLGALLWFTVSGQQAERTVTGVPVVYRNKPAAFEITDQTQVVDVHVQGIDSQLRNTQPRDFEVRVDLSVAKAGANTLPLRTDQVTAPFGIEVTQIEPGEARFVLEPSGSATVPVEPLIEGRPATGFVVSDIAVDPPTVTIVGPERRLSATTAATTERVVIEGATASHTSLVSIGVADAALRLKESRAARVTVRIEPSGARQFPAARVVVRNLGAGLQASVDPLSVALTLRGASGALARLEAAGMSPYVDVQGLGRGRHQLPVQLDLAGTLSLVAARPATVTVTIR